MNDASAMERPAEVVSSPAPVRRRAVRQQGYRVCGRSKRSWVALDREIQRNGCAILGTHGDPDHGAVCATYTVGLIERYQHPELVLLGVPHKQAERVLSALAGYYVYNGGRVPIESTLTGWEDAARYVAEVALAKRAAQLARRAATRCQATGVPFSAMQVIRRDAEGRLPWEPAFSKPGPVPVLPLCISVEGLRDNAPQAICEAEWERAA